MKNVISHFFFFLFSSLLLSAQQYPFINYTTQNGIINNNVKSIYQDQLGRMYFATYGGLSVFDGARFTNYTIKEGLVSNIINQVLELGADSMLIIPNGPGLNLLVHGIIKQFKTPEHFVPIINEVVLCQNGFFYAMSDEGLYKFDNNKFIKINFSGTVAGRAKNFSHGTTNGDFIFINSEIRSPVYQVQPIFLAYNIKTGETIFSENLPIINYSIRSPDNQILVATINGIFKVDLAALSEHKIRFVKADNYKTSFSTEILYMYFDNQKNLWATSNKGILKISSTNTKLYTKKNGLPLNLYNSIFQDRENIMWFANEQMGVTKMLSESIQFYPEIKKGFNVSCIYANASSDSVWFYDGNRNVIGMLYKNRFTEYTSDKFKMFGQFSIKGKDGVFFDASGIFKIHFIHHNRFTFSLVYFDSMNHLGYKGLIDKYGNAICVSDRIIFVQPNNKMIIKNLGYIADLPTVSNENFVWVLTRNQKLYLFQISHLNSENSYSLLHIFNITTPNLAPRSLAIDKENNIWVGTRNNGIYCYSYKKGIIALTNHLETKDGLSDNFIQYLYCDVNDNLWACSPSGVDRLNIKNGKISIDNITLNNNIHLNVYSVQCDRSGTAWGTTGVGTLKMNLAKSSLGKNYSPKILLSDMIAGSKTMKTPDKKMFLSYDQNNITFKVAAPSFYDERQTHFSFRLTGNGKSYWTEPGAIAEIHYAGLPPGKYTFQVKASFSNGLYPEKEADYLFEIKNPWWKSGWVYILYLIAIVFIAWVILRMLYIKSLAKEKNILERQKDIERERTRIATDMHDDLGSGLSRIAFLSETIKLKKSTGEVVDDDLNKIAGYSHEMISKMGEIVWALNEKNDSLLDLTSYTRAYTSEYLSLKGINCKFEIPDQVPNLLITGEIRRNIFLSVKEILHNIVKHSNANEVKFSLSIAKELKIVIHDNGKGIDFEQIRVFSNGIENLKFRMHEMGGFVTFHNENGTTVTLSIPLHI